MLCIALDFFRALAVALFWTIVLAAERKPNFVVLLADNLGYEDVSWFASQTTPVTSRTPTPNIDSIGAKGLTLTHWNSAAHLCSASRAALLTGMYPARTGVYPGVFHPDAALGLQPPPPRKSQSDSFVDSPQPNNMAFPTIATLLKERGGYATAAVGKWHLGHLPPYLPTRHGFDEYFGIPYHMSGGSVDNHTCAYDTTSANQWLPLYHNETIVEQPVNVHTLSARYAAAATSFIHRHTVSNHTPYFLYMAFSHVHQLCAAVTGREQSTCQWSAPLAGPAHRVDKSNDGQSSWSADETTSANGSTFGDAVAELDWVVGKILQAVESSGTANETLIIFTSDNGPWLAEQSCAGQAGPFRAQWYVDYQ
jgi:arylsulfatase A